MSDYLSRLKEIIRKHPLEEKVLVVSSYQEGRQIGEALVLQGMPWTNLRYATAGALAQETISLELAESGIRPIPAVTQFFLHESIFSTMKKQGRESYFSGLESETGLIRRFQKSISELRLEGLTAKDLSARCFENESKGYDLIRLMKKYEEALSLGKWVDEAGLYRLALEKAEEHGKGRSPLVICFQNRALAGLKRHFLQKYSQNRIIWLTRAPVAGLTPPRRYQRRKKPLPDPGEGGWGAFSWLFAPEKAPAFVKKDEPDIFAAVGSVNECREIMRRIHRANHRLDEVEIIYPPGSVYASHLYCLASRIGLGITFAEGIELGWTSPGKLFLGLLDWMESGYQAKFITRLIGSRNLKLPNETPELTPESAVRIIQLAKIGWGQSRYLDRLDSVKNRLQKNPPKDKSNEKKRRADIAAISELKTLFSRIFSQLPKQERSRGLKMKDFCEAITLMLDEFACIHNELDEAGRAIMRRRLTEASWIESPIQTQDSVWNWLRGLAGDVKVGASGPLPGHVHASSLKNGGFSGRSVTFVCGLDQGRFPGVAQEDPLILDKEREAAAGNLSLSTDTLRENLFDVAELLASVKGRLILSFSVYDVSQERESFPSSLVLQAFRLLNRNNKLDYSDLMDAVSPETGFIPPSSENALDTPEWWLARLSDRDRLRNAEPSVRNQYPDLDAGLRARKMRSGEKMSPFDGKIGDLPQAMNPLGRVLSVSRLEELAECPYKFFLHHILGLQPPEEIEFDPTQWLDPMERGSLLHEIYCDFMTELSRKGEQTQAGRHRSRLREIAESKLKQARRETPPPSQAVYAKERKEILDSLEIFLDLESKNDKSRPLLFEAPFGMSDKRGDAAPVKIPAGRKTILLRGIIDRIDQVGDNMFRVIDYKTGSFKKYEDLETFNEGKILQYALYALAAREIIRTRGLSDNPEIKDSGYFFPTLKGEGREMYFPLPSPQLLSQVLGILTRMIEEGLFPVNPEAACRYCDYAMLCGDSAKETAKEKKKTDPEAFNVFEELKEHK